VCHAQTVATKWRSVKERAQKNFPCAYGVGSTTKYQASRCPRA
jgi:hypothetical protein